MAGIDDSNIIGISDSDKARQNLQRSMSPLSVLLGQPNNILEQGLFPALGGATAQAGRNIGTGLGQFGSAVANNPIADFLFRGAESPPGLGQSGTQPLGALGQAPQLGADQQAQLDALGIPTPEANIAPSALGPGGASGAGGIFGGLPGVDLGPAFQAPDPLQLGRASEPDFSAVRAALGSGPEAPEEISVGEKLARVLGSAGAGAAQGLASGLTGQGAVGAVLGLAGGGAAQATTAISREEANRQSEFADRMERHNTNIANLETQAASAKSQTEMFNLKQKFAEAQNAQKMELLQAQSEQPTVQVGAGGVITYTAVRNGRMVTATHDPYAWLKEKIAEMENRPEHILDPQGNVLKRDAVTPQQAQTWDTVNTFNAMRGMEDPELADPVNTIMQQTTGFDDLDDLSITESVGGMTPEQGNAVRHSVAHRLLITLGVLQAPTAIPGIPE